MKATRVRFNVDTTVLLINTKVNRYGDIYGEEVDTYGLEAHRSHNIGADSILQCSDIEITLSPLSAEGRAATLDQWALDNFGFLTANEIDRLRTIANAIRRRWRE